MFNIAIISIQPSHFDLAQVHSNLNKFQLSHDRRAFYIMAFLSTYLLFNTMHDNRTAAQAAVIDSILEVYLYPIFL